MVAISYGGNPQISNETASGQQQEATSVGFILNKIPPTMAKLKQKHLMKCSECTDLNS